MSPVPQSGAVAQHIWPSSPHTTRGLHIPDMQESPGSQPSPAQHICPSPPQVGGGTHIPAVHMKPAVQTSPSQQGWPAPPQTVIVPHTPPVHTRPIPQGVPVVQQACAIAPHLACGTHVPLGSQNSPPLHTSPEQHDCAVAPHPPGIAESSLMTSNPGMSPGGTLES